MRFSEDLSQRYLVRAKEPIQTSALLKRSSNNAKYKENILWLKIKTANTTKKTWMFGYKAKRTGARGAVGSAGVVQSDSESFLY